MGQLGGRSPMALVIVVYRATIPVLEHHAQGVIQDPCPLLNEQWDLDQPSAYASSGVSL